jgi:hypothetical protein
VILVVDSTDRKNIKTVKEELDKMLAHEVCSINCSCVICVNYLLSLPPNLLLILNVTNEQSLRIAKILVFANKQDLKGAMTAAEISDALALHAIKEHDWHIQSCCALTGEGYVTQLCINGVPCLALCLPV